MIRLFVAVNLSKEVNERVATVVDPRLELAWVRPENYHLTLKFLGPTDAALLPVIEDTLRSTVRGRLPADIAARGLGVFPHEKNPRVLWAGIDDPDRRLAGLAEALDTQLEPLGFAKEERDYTPHLTIARVKTRGLADAIRELLTAHRDKDFGACRIDELVLYESRTLPTGPRYLPRFVLKAP